MDKIDSLRVRINCEVDKLFVYKVRERVHCNTALPINRIISKQINRCMWEELDEPL